MSSIKWERLKPHEVWSTNGRRSSLAALTDGVKSLQFPANWANESYRYSEYPEITDGH